MPYSRVYHVIYNDMIKLNVCVIIIYLFTLHMYNERVRNIYRLPVLHELLDTIIKEEMSHHLIFVPKRDYKTT